MAAFLDRLLLFGISILMINKSQVDYILVCLILVAIIMEGLISYFRSKRATMITAVIYIVIAIIEPTFAVFFPIIIYECTVMKLWYFVPVHILVAFAAYVGNIDIGILSRDTWMMLIFMMAAYAIGLRASRETRLKEIIHNLQDEGSYLEQKNRQSHEELVRKQDYEIHAATLTERNRIAREIHDHVGHMLSRSILQLGAILAVNKDEKQGVLLRGLKDTLDTAMNNIRESVHDLKDDALDLEYMVRDITEQYESLQITLDYDMGQFLSKELKYCFMAIVKEALTNTVKHSDGDRVTILMREHPALYQVLIEDNGTNSEKAVKKLNGAGGSSGIGLDNMRERVSAFGGNIRFSGENGFKIFISIPKEV